MKKKFLSIYFPNWSVNRIQSTLAVEHVHKGVLLTIRRNGQDIVAKCCNVARATKAIREGSTLSLAKAFLPQAAVRPLDAAADFKRLYKAAVYYCKYSPLVGLDAQILEAYRSQTLDSLDNRFFGINLDLTGTDRLHKNRNLITEMNQGFLRSRVEARMAIAPTLGLAWALSRFSAERISIFQEGALNEITDTLPVESLRLDAAVCSALREVGLSTVSLIKRVPRKNLLERYGKEPLRRLDQLTGELPESVSPIQLPNNWTVVREFEFPLLNHDSICHMVIELMTEVFKSLKAKGKVSKNFLLLMIIEDPSGDFYRDTKEFSFYSPTTDEQHLKAVVYQLVENLIVKGPIHVLMLTAKNAVKIRPEQRAFDKEDESRLAREELLNFFVSKLGERNVATIEYTNQYLPERSFRYRPVTAAKSLTISSEIRARPSIILPKPEKVSAIAVLPDSYPARLYWNGAELNISSGDGPERIESVYPNDKLRSEIRDYFKVQDQHGRWLWVFRSLETHEWYLQGFWM